MKKLVILLLLGTFSLNAQFVNIKISEENHPNEPSIQISSLDTNIIIAGANLNNVYRSTDGGNSWSRQELTSETHGVWGDPSLTVDGNGNFYFFHLANPVDGNWIDRIVCQKSIDNGNSWNDGSAAGLNGEKEQDKQWPVIDYSNGNIYITWTEFDNYGSSEPEDNSRILFSKSTDGGETWSSAIKINEIDGDCIDSDSTTEGAVPAVGPNGEIYVSWAGPEGLVFDKSFDQGETWLDNDIHISDIPGGWDYSIPGIYRANGLPITVCDLSGGSNNGTIYVNWSDQRNGIDDTDIWLSKSVDEGNTWSEPIRINDDGGGKHQFFTWMDIDQNTGDLYFIYYDRRDYDDNNTDVYLARSQNGGQSFENFKISESPFIPTPGVFFGDYNNISVQGDCIRPIWTRLQDGQRSVWTAIINKNNLENISTKTSANHSNNIDINISPNPVQNITYISYKLRRKSKVDIVLFDNSGKKIAQIVKNKKLGYGKYVEKIDVSKFNLSPGIYNLSLSIDGIKKKTQKISIIK